MLDELAAKGHRVATAPSDEVQAGTPVFAGTRVSVSILFDHLEEGKSLESFLREHRSITREQALV